MACGNIQTSTRGDNTWEAQVFFLKDGKYAVRAGNAAAATSGWAWVAGSYWTVEDAPTPIAQYQWDPAYIWELEIDEFKSQQVAAYYTATSWMTTIQSSNGLVTDPSNYISNAKSSQEGSYEALLDGNYNTYFHSAYSNGPDEDHYLQATLSNTTQNIYFYFKKRSDNNNNRPTTITISGSNDGSTFTDVTTINSGLPTNANILDYLSSKIDLGAAYKYLRFTVKATNNGALHNNHVFFTFSEFYIFPSNTDIDNVVTKFKALPSSAFDLTSDDIAAINEATTALLNTIVNVTYELYESDETTLVNSINVEQNKNSEVMVPPSLTSSSFYDYAVTGTVGSSDCTIKIVRTLKPGYVGALSDLSNNKAYKITCDRGKFLTSEGYLASTAHSSLSSAEPTNFAVISYEGNHYLYSIVDSKFVTNTGALAGDLMTDGFHGLSDALQMTPQAVPYFLFYFTIAEEQNYGLNTNGNDPYGYVINSWTNPDAGNKYFFIEADDFDPTAALEELEAYFHPSYTVTYVVKDELGNTIFTSDPQPTTLGTEISTLPAEYKRAFYTYNEDEVNVTIENLETTVEFTATWNGPFEISANFATAHWYDMAMRGTWYVTSAVKDGDGAYKTQNANTMGLVEDSYQWAFIGDGYKGFKIINKAEGEGKLFGYADAQKKDAGIPTVSNDNQYTTWNIVPSTNTSVPAGSFCLNVPGTDLYINQYGGAGGSVKFWNSTNNIGDGGSAFTIIDVPDDFASYVVDEIAPTLEPTGYFAFTDAVKAEIGYDPAYKDECPFNTYKSMKEKLAAIDMTDLSNFNLPENGYYRLKNYHYNSYMRQTGTTVQGNADGNADKDAASVVYLERDANNNFSIKIQGSYIQAPTAGSQAAGKGNNPLYFITEVPSNHIGYATFWGNSEVPQSALHSEDWGGAYNQKGVLVGWNRDAEASWWSAEKATTVDVTISDAGYATLYVPFAVTIPEGIEANTVTISDNHYTLVLTPITGTIPAGTPVLLSGEDGVPAPGTYTFEITNDVPALGVTNLLHGTYVDKTAEVGDYVLQKQEDVVGFYQVKDVTPKVPANRAYLTVPSGGGVKAFFLNGGDTDAIKSVFSAIAEGKIFDLSGRKVAKMQKGNTYIVNGKKVNVK